MTARLVVDLSNKSAMILNSDGRAKQAWSGVTRTSAAPLAYATGWRKAGPWTLTSPPDGFWCPVKRRIIWTLVSRLLGRDRRKP